MTEISARDQTNIYTKFFPLLTTLFFIAKTYPADSKWSEVYNHFI